VLAALASVLAATGIVDLAWGGGAHGGWSRIPYVLGLDGQMIAFLLIGTLFHLRFRQTLTSSVTAALVGLAFACFAWLWGRGPLAADVTAGVVSYGAALVVFACCFALRSRIRGNRALSWIADISYPLYVVHAMPGYAIMRIVLAARVSAWVGIAAAAIWAFGSAVLLHRIVEVPTRNLGRRLASEYASWSADRARRASGISRGQEARRRCLSPLTERTQVSVRERAESSSRRRSGS
jgi:peptidoglycan/LPS O-acetylase OafA/YrhL